jgi:hypothetical protein
VADREAPRSATLAEARGRGVMVGRCTSTASVTLCSTSTRAVDFLGGRSLLHIRRAHGLCRRRPPSPARAHACWAPSSSRRGGLR